MDPLVAAQGLRDLVDTLSPTGLVLILVDDLQWVDQESVESLYWLVHRARGDRLLLALASRTAALSLIGLSLAQAVAAVLAVHPGADPDAIRRLRGHCGRSPFT